MSPYALVTGASKRIGKAIAVALADMGYSVLLHFNHSVEEAKATQKLIEEKGQMCIPKRADLKNDDDIRSLITNLPNEIPLEILVNNASDFGKSSLKTPGTDYLDALFKVNFKAPYILTKQFAQRCEHGLIINLLDTKINRHMSEYSDYWLTKKMLEAFTKLSATQFAPGIRVNGIAPGLILPPEGKTESYLQNLAQSVPLKRSGDPDNLTETLKFLINNTYITGEIIHVDGGEHL